MGNPHLNLNPTLEPHWYPSVPKSRRAVLSIDYEIASLQFWMDAGHEALSALKHRCPHALISFTHLARLLEIGFNFGCLACNLALPLSTARKKEASGSAT